MSDNYQQPQAQWEWLQEDEQRCEAENMDCDRDIAMYEYFDTQKANEAKLRDLEVEAYLITAESKPARNLPTRNKAHLIQRAINLSKAVAQEKCYE